MTSYILLTMTMANDIYKVHNESLILLAGLEKIPYSRMYQKKQKHQIRYIFENPLRAFASSQLRVKSVE